MSASLGHFVQFGLLLGASFKCCHMTCTLSVCFSSLVACHHIEGVELHLQLLAFFLMSTGYVMNIQYSAYFQKYSPLYSYFFWLTDELMDTEWLFTADGFTCCSLFRLWPKWTLLFCTFTSKVSIIFNLSRATQLELLLARVPSALEFAEMRTV